MSRVSVGGLGVSGKVDEPEEVAVEVVWGSVRRRWISPLALRH